ncbi:MAG: hypothetical protein J1F17_03790 [Oscillospiraceae bacterium]|nr:hypothetical protein [Oscillospiraceae bacterium]
MAKKSRKIFCVVSILLMAVLLFSTACLVGAEEVIPGDTQVVDPAPVETDPIYTQAPVVDTTAAPVYTQAPVVDTTAAPVYTTAPYYEEPQQYYTEYTQPYSFYQQPVTEFYNQENYYEAETTEATDNTTSLIESNREIDDTELNKSDWEKIADELAKAEESDDTDSPFDYIKNADKATGLTAFFNNLNWPMTAGIICFVLAIVCIVIFIVFTKKMKKGDKKPSADKKKNFHGNNGGRRTSAVTDEEGYYVPQSRRSNSDYGDDYDSSAQKRMANRRAKEDTAEINIPKKYRK